VCAIIAGAFMSVGLIALSPTIWVDILKNPTAVFPLRNPAIIAMPFAFIAGIVGSLTTTEARAKLLFDDEKLRVYLGVGAE
jgi:cation/acetate symporter